MATNNIVKGNENDYVVIPVIINNVDSSYIHALNTINTELDKALLLDGDMKKNVSTMFSSFHNTTLNPPTAFSNINIKDLIKGCKDEQIINNNNRLIQLFLYEQRLMLPENFTYELGSEMHMFNIDTGATFNNINFNGKTAIYTPVLVYDEDDSIDTPEEYTYEPIFLEYVEDSYSPGIFTKS